MGDLPKQLRDVAVRVAPLGSLSGDTRWEAAELMRKAAAALAAQQDGVREAWQSMETAPKDGTHVLASEDGVVSEAYYESDRGVWCLANTHWTDATRSEIWPQFWQPVPQGKST